MEHLGLKYETHQLVFQDPQLGSEPTSGTTVLKDSGNHRIKPSSHWVERPGPNTTRWEITMTGFNKTPGSLRPRPDDILTETAVATSSASWRLLSEFSSDLRMVCVTFDLSGGATHFHKEPKPKTWSGADLFINTILNLLCVSRVLFQNSHMETRRTLEWNSSLVFFFSAQNGRLFSFDQGVLSSRPRWLEVGMNYRAWTRVQFYNLCTWEENMHQNKQSCEVLASWL